MIPLVDQGDINGGTFQILHSLKSAETPTDNDNTMPTSTCRAGGIGHHLAVPFAHRTVSSRCGTGDQSTTSQDTTRSTHR